ncbi:mercury methylation ferredoxin HgcB [Candidatus Eisenbacteria bacterium]|uniref:Mercury methylation ferredoxin HgcB n=1 Tax=Eiseniibacteriota bacterium TaxID=2212470 RepID=A0ABV6YIX1_UNCEI
MCGGTAADKGERLTMLNYLTGVVTLQLREDACIGCGMCVTVCPHGVFILNTGKARITDRDRCIECGACAGNCPVGAIDVQAGVGCATGHILASLGSTSECCCAGERSQPTCCPTPKNGDSEPPCCAPRG